jgi:NADPH-dependent 2,4-dienoyl-CoA reductase/sulfur reductase-like enzyme
MFRVCVIGGGTAGSEAALEAASRGADVTVIERSDRPEPPWKFWPDLIRTIPTARNLHSGRCSARHNPSKILVTEAESVSPGSVITSGGRRMQFDSIIVATGTTFEQPTFQGRRKPGVYVLDTSRAYAELGHCIDSMDRAVVAGEGSRGLKVAERISGRQREVHLFVSHWRLEGPSPPVLQVLEDAARGRCVSITTGVITRAVGSGSLEAVVTGGEVLPCTVLAIVPSRIPRVIPMRARLGRAGGLVVDRGMRTTAANIYAAGGCAELGTGFSLSHTLEMEASLSGRIAGSNCTGELHNIGLIRYSETTVLGLRWTRVGMGTLEARLSGVGAETVSRRWGQSSACSITFEKNSRRVLGVECVESADVSTSGVFPVISGVGLQTLAYGGLGSSDISMVSDTARLGLRDCQGS